MKTSYRQLSKSRDGQRGQSLIIIAAGMVVFLALVAVVVDAGNDYVQKRQLQNSVDAASQAGAITIATAPNTNATNSTVMAAINGYLLRDGTDPTTVSAYYVARDATGNNYVDTVTILGHGGSSPVPPAISVSGSSYPVVGVFVQASRTFHTFFAAVIGFPQLTVSANSPTNNNGGNGGISGNSGNGDTAGYVSQGGTCSSTGLFPVALVQSTFPKQTNGTYKPVINATYTIFDKGNGGGIVPGNFGWLTWNGDTSASTLAYNIDAVRLGINTSGPIHVGDNIEGTTGSKSSMSASVQWYIDTRTPVIIPVFDVAWGNGSSSIFHTVGFALFTITAQNMNANPKQITGYFMDWVNPTDEGNCANFGIVGLKLRPPVNNVRTVVGSVKLQKLTRIGSSGGSTHMPVDVMNVVSIDSRMSNGFGAMNKIQAIGQSVAALDNAMQPSLGDQVGLTVFPLNNGAGSTSSTRYNYSCTQSGRSTAYYKGQLLSDLTNNVAAVNGLLSGLTPAGYLPTAGGMLTARGSLFGPSHIGSNLRVIVLAVDGSASVTALGQWTGFANNSYTAPACNGQADQDAILQANIAKADSNGSGMPDTIVYVVAVGNDFDPSELRAMASPDVDPTRQHFFVAADATALSGIYTQIATEIQSIQQTCQVIVSEAFAPNTSVNVTYPDGSMHTLTTDATGQFYIANAAVGIYQVTSASVSLNGLTYNMPTNGIGGPATSWPITIQAGTPIATYSSEVDLATSSTISCDD